MVHFLGSGFLSGSSLFMPLRLTFFSELEQLLDNHIGENIILAGDFNCILDPFQDQQTDKGLHAQCVSY